MLIVGAGMAGLLAGHMLRRHSPVIVEAQSELPNNHAALLRFRTAKVQDATGIPFKRVVARKYVFAGGIVTNLITIADSNEYSIKVTGECRDRSVLDLTPGERYIAPEDFIAQMAKGLQIQYGYDWHPKFGYEEPSTVSTIPMPTLMKAMNWPNPPEFKHKQIWTGTAYITKPVTDLYQTIYYPNKGVPYYRASITGNRLTIEYTEQPASVDLFETHINVILSHFGIKSRVYDPTFEFASPPVKHQYFGKILPTDESERKAFICAMTDKHNIWSLGRFATWRQLLLDDVVDDIKFIDRVVTQKDSYERRMHHHNS